MAWFPAEQYERDVAAGGRPRQGAIGEQTERTPGDGAELTEQDVALGRAVGAVAGSMRPAEALGFAPMIWADEEFEELEGIENADELCRRLLESPAGWGRSTRHMEAVDLLAKVRGTGRVPMSLLALLLCDCWRWRRITAKLIAAIEASGLLDDRELDELADAFLAREHVISYPLAWVSPQWLEIELDTGRSRTVTVSEATIAERRFWFAPPLRRWAARRALRADPARLEQLSDDAQLLEPRHRDALISGLLDCADRLDENRRRRLVARGLRATQASTRRGALDVLCELDGPEQALGRARADTYAAVRSWRPRTEAHCRTPTLLDAA